MVKKKCIAPSILCSDFSNLSKTVDIIENSPANWYHMDVMDGVFVPNISFGSPVLEAIKKISTKPIDVHLMITQPERYLKMFSKWADIISVHLEVCNHLDRTIQKIKDLGIKASVAINPSTPVSALECIAHQVDMILIMSVNPGFGGQKFLKHTYQKVSTAKKLLHKQGNTAAYIQVDGGINLENAKILLENGADSIVVGNGIFKSKDPKKVINDLSIICS